MTNAHGKPKLLVNGERKSATTIVLAHGAGAGMDSDFMTAIAEGLAGHHFCVVRFEFPYMAARRESGNKRPPDREPVLRETWLDVIASLDAETLIIGGKSLGGRIASLIADDIQAAGLVCLGYPFHPTGKPQKLRVEHLKSLQTPTLILQGQRDTFGNQDEVAGYELSQTIRIHWLPDGDHSFKPRKASGTTQAENWVQATHEFVRFVRDRK